MITGSVGFSTHLTARRIACQKAPLAWRVGNFLRHRLLDLPRLWAARLARLMGATVITSELRIKVRKQTGEWIDYGLVSTRVVTTVGVNYLVDAWQNSVELEIMKYHGAGTTNTAEDIGDTTLAAECTTTLNPDSTRATGSLTEGGGANVLRSVGTLTFDGNASVVEHGIFNQAATGGGTLWDRSVFGVITVVSGDSIQFTYDCTIAAGS